MDSLPNFVSNQLVKPRTAHVKLTFLLFVLKLSASTMTYQLDHILPLLLADIIQGGVPVPVVNIFLGTL